MAQEYICKNCEHIGEARITKRSNWFISMFLWSFIIPGILYYIWIRINNKECSHCLSTSLLSLRSKEGKELFGQYLNNKITKIKK